MSRRKHIHPVRVMVDQIVRRASASVPSGSHVLDAGGGQSPTRCWGRPRRQGAGIYDRDKVLHLFEGASEISFVTVWSSPLRLEQQLHEKFQHSKPNKRDHALLKICRQPVQIINLYRRWFDFCEKQGSKTRNHYIVELGDKLKFHSRPEWEDMVRICGE